MFTCILLFLPLSLPAQVTGSNLEGTWVPLDEFVVYDADGDSVGTTDDQVRIDGDVFAGVASADFCTTLLSSGSCNHDIHLGASVVVGGGLHVEADVAASLATDVRLPVPSLPMPGFSFPIGNHVVSIVPVATPFLHLEGAMDGGASLDLTFTHEYPLGLSYDQGVVTWDQPTTDPFVKAATPALPAATTATLQLRPRLGIAFTVELDGAPIGIWPQVAFDMGLVLDIAPNGDPWWTLDGELGVLGSIGPSLVDPVYAPWAPLMSWNAPLLDAGGPFGGLGSGANVRWTRAYESLSPASESARAVVPSPTAVDGWLIAAERGSFGAFLEVDAAGLVVDAFQLSPLTDAFVPTNGTDTPNGPVFVGGDHVLALDQTADVRWHVALGQGSAMVPPRLLDVAPDGAGGVYVCGSVLLPSTAEWHPFLARFDGNGNLLWARHYLGPVGQRVGFRALAPVTGGVVAVGNAPAANVGTGQFAAGVVQVAADGSVDWQVAYTNVEHTAEAWGVAAGPNGELYVAGQLQRNINFTDPYELFVLRLDPAQNGALVWGALYAEEDDGGNSWRNVFDEAQDVIADGDGAVVVATTNPALTAPPDALAWRVGPDGRTTWFKAWHGNEIDRLRRVVPTPDGGFLMAGETGSFAVGGVQDLVTVWLAKTGSEGFVQWDPALGGGRQLTPERRATYWETYETLTPADVPVDLTFTPTFRNSSKVPLSYAQEDLTRR